MTAEIPQPTSDDKRYEKTYGIERRTAREIKLDGPGYAGPVELQVRTEGALIRDLQIGDTKILVSADTKDPDTGDDFFQPVKTDATITMLPAGQSEVGRQHGASRYLDYAIESSAGNSLELVARDRLKNLGHLKTFILEPDGLSITDDVVNTGDSDTGISVGEHFYFAAQEADLAAIKFLDEIGAEQSITARRLDGTDETGSFSAFLPELNEGRAVYYDAFTGNQVISIPGLGDVTLQASATAEGQEKSVGLLMWHRPGSNSICFEPVSGITIDNEGGMQNQGIALAPGNSVILTSRVRVKPH